MTNYNGHKNYQTWNVSLWINNDESLYSNARRFNSYKDFTDYLRDMMQITETPDNVSFSDKDLDFESLNNLIQSIE